MHHFISLSDASRPDLDHIFDVAFKLRDERTKGKTHKPILANKTLAMIFEKPSLRTRVSFEEAMLELGGHAIVMSAGEVGLGKRETAADAARVLNGMVHAIMARVYEHQKLLDLAAHSSNPVINALSDYSHPCQVLADAMTMMDEFGRDLAGRTIAYIGDGNNVARSLAVFCQKFKLNFTIASPPGYELEDDATDSPPPLPSPGAGEGRGEGSSKHHAPTKITKLRDPLAAVKHADAIYTDTWISMGQEAEEKRRKKAFAPYQVNEKLLAAAPKHAIVLHCLPAYRGLEISAETLEGPRSRVFPQAHNRLHAQKGLLAILMAGA